MLDHLGIDDSLGCDGIGAGGLHLRLHCLHFRQRGVDALLRCVLERFGLCGRFLRRRTNAVFGSGDFGSHCLLRLLCSLGLLRGAVEL